MVGSRARFFPLLAEGVRGKWELRSIGQRPELRSLEPAGLRCGSDPNTHYATLPCYQ